MRVVLIGSPGERARLRAEIPRSGVEIAGEAETMADARAIGYDADAYLIARSNGRVDHVLDRDPDESEDIEREALTPRELEVLGLLAEGLPNKAIARRLDISDQTVKFHVAAIYGKLGAANRTDAVRRAVRRGLVVL
ncbi:MAG TPA: response regulator transcription factor [Vicinamibacterales bacterium]|nr:response regulator transcription factor [Vicinamibacterales bacterium]